MLKKSVLCKRLMIFIACLCLFVQVSACGQKGPLILPEQAEQQK